MYVHSDPILFILIHNSKFKQIVLLICHKDHILSSNCVISLSLMNNIVLLLEACLVECVDAIVFMEHCILNCTLDKNRASFIQNKFFVSLGLNTRFAITSFFKRVLIYCRVLYWQDGNNFVYVTGFMEEEDKAGKIRFIKC